MLMDNKTIVTLYREAVDNGDPKEVIKSMAKTNGCTPGEIRQILNDAGEFVPRQKRDRPKAEVAHDGSIKAVDLANAIEDAISEKIEERKRVGNMSAQEAAGDEPAAGHKTLEESGWTEVVLPIPDAVKRCIMKGLDDIEAQITRKQDELANLEAEYKTISDYIRT